MICKQKLITLLLVFVFSSSIFANTHDPYRKKLENSFNTLNKISLQQRMEQLKISGLSIAIIEESKLKHVETFGFSNKEKKVPVTADTFFQAGSISKSFTGMGVLKLVEMGKVDLDRNINNYLSRWKLKDNEHNKHTQVTARMLLSHTAGTSVSGFDGYERNAPIPTLLQVLDGSPPANSKPIKIISTPGKKWNYSGGGTTILQLMIEDVTGKKFDEWMKENLLVPLRMNQSSFKQPPTMALKFATGYKPNGEPVKGEWHVYPELAAAGLWTNPTELANSIIQLNNILQGKSSLPISKSMFKQMLTPQVSIQNSRSKIGLGLELRSTQKSKIFLHQGGNEGFIALWFGYVNEPQGTVIMINSDGEDAWLFMKEIYLAICKTQGWEIILFV